MARSKQYAERVNILKKVRVGGGLETLCRSPIRLLPTRQPREPFLLIYLQQGAGQGCCS